MTSLHLLLSPVRCLLKGIVVLLLVAMGLVPTAFSTTVVTCKSSGMMANTPACLSHCAAMPCCAMKTQTEHSQPPAAPSSGHQQVQLDPLLLRAAVLFTIYGAFPHSETHPAVSSVSLPARAFTSLAQLCIRLT
ncbi:MAG: hypothetical protein QM796_20000 [Chthoniobacteraceae bacterium]